MGLVRSPHRLSCGRHDRAGVRLIADAPAALINDAAIARMAAMAATTRRGDNHSIQ